MKWIKHINNENSAYPEALKEIGKPPKVLYYRGDLEALNTTASVAIVGTRRCSEYGKEATKNITKELAKAGITIISGLARGIDTYAHETALEYKAKTIAVLGSGLDDKKIYPKQNLRLAHKIIESGGLLLSEYEPGSTSWPSNFPERNRIVAGLSLGTVLVEAPFKSGAMITARLSVDEGREVFAVPGPIFSRLSDGPNYYIKQGAKCITSGNDVLEELSLTKPLPFATQEDSAVKNLTKNEELVLKLISEASEAVHLDVIIQNIKMDTSEVSNIITSLVLDDLIIETEPGKYRANI